MTNKVSREKCIFCGSEEDITREHAVSKNLFPDSHPKNKLVTLPSCQPCNRSYSHDEELFRIFLVNQSTEKSQAAIDILHTKITRSMKRSSGKTANVLKKMLSVKIQLPDGSLVDKVAFSISKEDWKRYHRVLSKYVEALFYQHIGVKIPDNHEISHVFLSDPSKITDDVKSVLVWNLDNEHIYAYAYAYVPETLQSTWTFVFYDTVIFQSFTAAPGDLSSTE